MRNPTLALASLVPALRLAASRPIFLSIMRGLAERRAALATTVLPFVTGPTLGALS
jgi:hypothetical protein